MMRYLSTFSKSRVMRQGCLYFEDINMFKHPSRKSLQERQLDIRYETLRVQREYERKVLLLNATRLLGFLGCSLLLVALIYALTVGVLLL